MALASSIGGSRFCLRGGLSAAALIRPSHLSAVNDECSQGQSGHPEWGSPDAEAAG